MSTRIALVSLLLLAGVAALSPTGANAAGTPTCKGRTATHWLTSPGSLIVSENDAVVVGTSGADLISVLGANPLVCAGGGQDAVTLNTGGTAYLGSGNDSGVFIGGAIAHGESGADNLVSQASTLYGDSGDDSLNAGTGSTAVGGSGADTISGFAAVALLGGSGKDAITVFTPSNLVDCGPDKDTLVLQQPATTIKRCENAIS